MIGGVHEQQEGGQACAGEVVAGQGRGGAARLLLDGTAGLKLLVIWRLARP